MLRVTDSSTILDERYSTSRLIGLLLTTVTVESPSITRSPGPDSFRRSWRAANSSKLARPSSILQLTSATMRFWPAVQEMLRAVPLPYEDASYTPFLLKTITWRLLTFFSSVSPVLLVSSPGTDTEKVMSSSSASCAGSSTSFSEQLIAATAAIAAKQIFLNIIYWF